jgi:biotin-(acetyl-CoA carboxylase) ligase
MLGERVLVTEAHDQYEAIACDIDNKGQLIITKDDGETRTLASGEVSIRPQA